MPSFSDSIFLFLLALLLFGPKKLPVLARELGKWIGEFRRASNEFKMQMEEELRQAEQEDRQKQIAAMEAAAPVPQPAGPVAHPHLPDTAAETIAETAEAGPATASGPPAEPAPETPAEPLPIATAGELKMMPPSTGLPAARSATRANDSERSESADPLGGLLEAIPSSPRPASWPEPASFNAHEPHEPAEVAVAAEGESRGR